MPAMTTGSTGTGTLTPAASGAAASGNVFVPEVWSSEIQMARTNKLIMDKLVNKKYQRDLRYGDTVHITAIAEMTADAMTPGTALVPVAPNETESTLLVDRYYGKAIEIHEILKKQSFVELRRPYTEVMGRALATAIDTSFMDQHANVLAGNKRTAIATMTFAEIVEAHALLDIANVPMEDRALVINGRILADLRKLPEFTAYDETGREGVREKQIGIVGTIYGTPVYVTNAVQTLTGAYQALLFHRDAFTAVIQIRPDVETDRDILKKTDIISMSALWGVKTIRPDHAVVLRRTV